MMKMDPEPREPLAHVLDAEVSVGRGGEADVLVAQDALHVRPAQWAGGQPRIHADAGYAFLSSGVTVTCDAFLADAARLVGAIADHGGT